MMLIISLISFTTSKVEVIIKCLFVDKIPVGPDRFFYDGISWYLFWMGLFYLKGLKASFIAIPPIVPPCHLTQNCQAWFTYFSLHSQWFKLLARYVKFWNWLHDNLQSCFFAYNIFFHKFCSPGYDNMLMRLDKRGEGKEKLRVY